MVGIINIGAGPSSRYAAPDYSGLVQGGAAIGQGLAGLGQGFGQMFKNRRDRDFRQGLGQFTDPDDVLRYAFEHGRPDDPAVSLVMQRLGMEPEETWEDVTLADGRTAQRSSRSGLLKNIMDPLVDTTAERPMKKDANGRWRYIDTQELVFPDLEVTPEAPSLTTLQKNLAAAGLPPGSPEYQKAIMDYLSKSGLQVNFGGENGRAPAEYHPTFGEPADDRHMWDVDPVTNEYRIDPETGYPRQVLKPGVMTSGAQTDVEKAATASEDALARLDTIAQGFDPELLTLPTQTRNALMGFVDRLGFDIGDEARAELTDATTFKQSVVDNMNRFIKEITGAQMSEAEAERIMKGVPNMEDGPTEFAAKFNASVGALREILARKAAGTDMPAVPELSSTGSDSPGLIDQATAAVGNALVDPGSVVNAATPNAGTGQDATVPENLAALSNQEWQAVRERTLANAQSLSDADLDRLAAEEDRRTGAASVTPPADEQSVVDQVLDLVGLGPDVDYSTADINTIVQMSAEDIEALPPAQQQTVRRRLEEYLGVAGQAAEFVASEVADAISSLTDPVEIDNMIESLSPDEKRQLADELERRANALGTQRDAAEAEERKRRGRGTFTSDASGLLPVEALFA